MWDPRIDRPLAALHGHTAAITSAEFDPAGARVVKAWLDGTARV